MAANLMPSNPVNMMSPNSPDPMAVNLMPSYYMNLMPANLMEPLVKMSFFNKIHDITHTDLFKHIFHSGSDKVFVKLQLNWRTTTTKL